MMAAMPSIFRPYRVLIVDDEEPIVHIVDRVLRQDGYETAMAWADRAREIFTGSGDQLRLARLAGNLANILFRQDRAVEALKLYEDALEAQRPRRIFSDFDERGEPFTQRHDVACVADGRVCAAASTRQTSSSIERATSLRDQLATGIDREFALLPTRQAQAGDGLGQIICHD